MRTGNVAPRVGNFKKAKPSCKGRVKSWERRAMAALADGRTKPGKRGGVRRSNVIGNRSMKHAGGGIIWTTV